MIRPVFLLGVGLSLLVAGCGGQANATKKGPTHTPPTSTTTPTIVAETLTATPVSTASPTPAPTATPGSTAVIQTIVPNNQEPVVVSANVIPQTVGPGGRIHISVLTRGPVKRVVAYLGTVGPQAPAPVSYELGRGYAGHWAASGNAPSVAGTYGYTFGLYDPSGQRNVVSGQNWLIQVGSSQPANGPQPFPNDVPYAPPFSYGAPVAATFVAEGKTINGSEVSSNQRPDVSPDAIAQFYASRLPRNGWTVDHSTIPPAGSTAWILAATKPGRMVAIQFGHATVHIFYGTTS